MRSRLGTILITALLCLAPTASWADLTPYSQDFEGLVQGDPAALANDGWLVFGNVFNADLSYAYGYGVFPAPNGGAGFSAIDAGQGDAAQGTQQLSVYSDYNNQDHGAGRFIEANVFQERTVGAADVGNTWNFEFDAKRGNIDGVTTALAFFKTLDPNAGYALTNFISADMTGIPAAWGTYSLSIVIDPSLVGQIFQFGFASTATGYQGSGIFYDNIDFSVQEAPHLEPYSQDFEGLVQADPAALADDGWLVFANVFNADLSYAYGYGAFPAPNGGAGFSAVDAGQGDAPQGAQQLSVYSDYNNQDHGNGRFIEANVFQEQIVGAADIGKTFAFEFDARRGNIEGVTTALAFFKTLDPNNGYALTNFISVDMTGVPNAWGHYSLSIFIDPSLQGQIFQFGFASTATAYQGSGVFYDNVKFGEPEVRLTPYSQDFEGLVQADPAALADDGWLVFANVFNADSSYAYGYGVFPAPNGGAGFSAIDAGQGGAAQGARQLSVYSDYNNQDHGNGRFIEANVFQEQVVGTADVGKTYVFEFDAKRGNIEGLTTALAFIKTLDPGAGFALTNFITVDMTDTPSTWGSFALSIFIDPSLEGQILQFGFLSNATGYQGSGIFYDNIKFAEEEELLIELEYFRANLSKRGVTLSWATTFELDTVGFRLLRGVADGSKTLELLATIPARGNNLVGAGYTFHDTTAPSGTLVYYLEDVDIFGRTQRHGPVSIERGSRGGRFLGR